MVHQFKLKYFQTKAIQLFFTNRQTDRQTDRQADRQAGRLPFPLMTFHERAIFSWRKKVSKRLSITSSAAFTEEDINIIGQRACFFLGL